MRERDGGATMCVYTYTYTPAKTSNTVYMRVTRAQFNEIGQFRSYNCRGRLVATTRELARHRTRILSAVTSLTVLETRIVRTGIAERLPQIIAARNNSVPTATIRDARTCDSRVVA